jgi:hypothetical protein
LLMPNRKNHWSLDCILMLHTPHANNSCHLHRTKTYESWRVHLWIENTYQIGVGTPMAFNLVIILAI